MTLDINTEKGQETLEQERKMAALWEAETGWKYVNTPKSGASAVDALLLDGKVVRGIAEQKSRNMSHHDFRYKFGSEWLVTYDKIRKLRKVSELLQVPSWGFLWLVPDSILLLKQITNGRGEMVVNMRTDRTQTQATCNGGVANRYNAYLDLAHCEKTYNFPI